MMEEGKYIYCIIGTNEGRNFGPIGIGDRGDGVYTIGYQDLSAVISNSPMTKYVVSRENMTAHEKVIEEVMKDYSVLPVRFCTVATSAEEVRNLLRKRYTEFKNLLRDMDNKTELGVRALWKNMNAIFQEIVDENKKIKQLREKIAAKPSDQTYADKIALGEMVKASLEAKKEREGREILDGLKKSSVDFRTNKIYGDNMILNAAFLVDRSREKEFDNQVDELSTKYDGRIKFKYVGPVPPFNFVNIVVKWK
ncbi:GvpL/GvpF family gas vesicle protein [Candidatus Hakubella thermalkaliphila]|uniref:Gas vesicle synthesis GvpLGvpF n=3 Tax=Candidatus Hakubella thermalkaliphila TaxID=2754717 RepID=A0A6V8Q3E8_9ACTN|nr:GvpL/GvpF family gas vesicle protein [Candidatus Hakubella thermalkaliphila]GFP30520.1 hypothetical protein HKBW3S34_01440 [Candidatus Hakubella thermalkaliphila]GFP39013.1 hypothetical protein HKBW3S47_00713 [Candidatus Hakubella thermalkaliphila]